MLCHLYSIGGIAPFVACFATPVIHPQRAVDDSAAELTTIYRSSIAPNRRLFRCLSAKNSQEYRASFTTLLTSRCSPLPFSSAKSAALRDVFNPPIIYFHHSFSGDILRLERLQLVQTKCC